MEIMTQKNKEIKDLEEKVERLERALHLVIRDIAYLGSVSNTRVYRAWDASKILKGEEP